MTSSWNDVYQAFLFKIKNKSDFFNYFNLDDFQAEELVLKQSKGFLVEAITKLYSRCSPDVNFYDYDKETETFDFEITDFEVDMLARLMFEVMLEKDMGKLMVQTNMISSQDLRQLFSGYNERNSFVNMLQTVKEENRQIIDRYISQDRKTMVRKEVDSLE